MSITSLPHKNLYVWTVVLTVVTIFGGILAIVSGIGIEGIPVTPDIPGGCILLLLRVLLVRDAVPAARPHIDNRLLLINPELQVPIILRENDHVERGRA